MKHMQNGYSWVDKNAPRPRFTPVGEKERAALAMMTLVDIEELWKSDKWMVYSVQDALIDLVRSGTELTLEQLKIMSFHSGEYRQRHPTE